MIKNCDIDQLPKPGRDDAERLPASGQHALIRSETSRKWCEQGELKILKQSLNSTIAGYSLGAAGSLVRSYALKMLMLSRATQIQEFMFSRGPVKLQG